MEQITENIAKTRGADPSMMYSVTKDARIYIIEALVRNVRLDFCQLHMDNLDIPEDVMFRSLDNLVERGYLKREPPSDSKGVVYEDIRDDPYAQVYGLDLGPPLTFGGVIKELVAASTIPVKGLLARLRRKKDGSYTN